jgi:hypothetical protein
VLGFHVLSYIEVVDPVWGFFLLGGMGWVAVSTARALSIFWVFTCLCLMRRGAEVNFVRSNVQNLPVNDQKPL